MRVSQRKVSVKLIEKNINHRLIAEYFAKKFNEERGKENGNVYCKK